MHCGGSNCCSPTWRAAALTTRPKAEWLALLCLEQQQNAISDMWALDSLIDLGAPSLSSFLNLYCLNWGYKIWTVSMAPAFIWVEMCQIMIDEIKVVHLQCQVIKSTPMFTSSNLPWLHMTLLCYPISSQRVTSYSLLFYTGLVPHKMYYYYYY